MCPNKKIVISLFGIDIELPIFASHKWELSYLESTAFGLFHAEWTCEYDCGATKERYHIEPTIIVWWKNGKELMEAAKSKHLGIFASDIAKIQGREE